jgi:AmmeMemoRadiSam system protein B
VQFAFLKYYIYDCEIVEMVYGDENPKNIKKIIDFLLSYEDIGVIISTDLSHFYNLKKAQELDGICLEAIDKSNTELFAKGCEACGILGMRAMVDVAKEKGMKPYILDYRTSADVSKDTTSVVGYVSVAYEE